MNDEKKVVLTDDETGGVTHTLYSIREVDHSGEKPTCYLEIDIPGEEETTIFSGPEVGEIFDVVSDAYMTYCEDLEAEHIGIRLPGHVCDALIDGNYDKIDTAKLLHYLRGCLPADRESGSYEAIMGRINERRAKVEVKATESDDSRASREATIQAIINSSGPELSGARQAINDTIVEANK